MVTRINGPGIDGLITQVAMASQHIVFSCKQGVFSLRLKKALP